MNECAHVWKKWEKEQPMYVVGSKDGYYQRRECKTCGMAEWKQIAIIEKAQP